MKRTIQTINTEVDRVKCGEFVVNHEMAHKTRLVREPEGQWIVTLPNENTIRLNPNLLSDVLRGQCGFGEHTPTVLAAMLDMELTSAQNHGNYSGAE